MRDHIRREAAGTYSAYWLVPVVFAAAAMAAVAMIDPQDGQRPTASQATTQPAAAAVIEPAAAAAPRPVDGIVEVTDHVQSF
jgi:hypothetical protein